MKPPEIRVDVEPLGEARWERIGRSLFDRLDRASSPGLPPPPPPRAWRGPALLVMAGALAACIGGLAARTLWHSEPAAVAPSHVATGASGTHLTIGEAALDVGPASALLVSGDDARGVLVILEHGRIECEVAPRLGRPPFVVQAGDVRARVVGTHFSVERTEDGARVDVTKGVVEVSARGEVHALHAGERWPYDPEPLPPASDDSAGPAPTAKPQAAPPHAPPRKSAGAPHPDEPPAPAPEPEETAAPPATAIEAPPPPTATASAPPPPSESPRALYEAAARLESRDPAAALARYRELARGSGPWAANALYAAGRLEADRGARDEARRALREYLTRFPGGANAADARDLLNRIR